MSQTKILIIEDDRQVADALQLMLEFRGYAVDQANDGSAGLRAIKASSPDIIITDMVLPELDGIGVLKAIRTEYPKIPVLAISGMGPEHGDLYLNLASKLGANAILRKPVRTGELLDAINRLLSSDPLVA
jgi:DNA-binding response OmpR family regulator